MSKPVHVRFPSAWIALALLFAAPAISWGQGQVAYSISGVVSDKANQPLIGVAVQLLETRQGTLTDLDGKYMLEGTVASGTYTLQMSYLGYANFTKTVTIDDANRKLDLNVTLEEDALALDEVVVTGSTLKSTRRQLGNAVNIVNAEALQKSGTDNLLSALQGKIAGAQVTQNSGDPSGGLSVRLRGVNSIRGNSDPLYVIDGVVVSNSTTNVTQVSVSAGAADRIALHVDRERADDVLAERLDGVGTLEEQDETAVADAEGVVAPHVNVGVGAEGLADAGVHVLGFERLEVAVDHVVGGCVHARADETDVAAERQDAPDDAARAALEEAVRRDEHVSQLLLHAESLSFRSVSGLLASFVHRVHFVHPVQW